MCVEHQIDTRCLTARFRIQSKPIFGTLLAAFAANLKETLNKEEGYSDHLLPDFGDEAWQELQKLGFGRRLDTRHELVSQLPARARVVFGSHQGLRPRARMRPQGPRSSRQVTRPVTSTASG